MATCAVIDAQGTAVNFIIAEPTDPAPEGCTLMEIPDGFYWDGSAVSPIPVVTDGN